MSDKKINSSFADYLLPRKDPQPQQIISAGHEEFKREKQMRLVKIQALTGKDGRTSEFWINPQQIISITTVNIPGKLTRPDGMAIMEEKTAIDFGVKALVTNLTVDEVIEEIFFKRE